MDTERITDTRITPNKQGCGETFPQPCSNINHYFCKVNAFSNKVLNSSGALSE